MKNKIKKKADDHNQKELQKIVVTPTDYYEFSSEESEVRAGTDNEFKKRFFDENYGVYMHNHQEKIDIRQFISHLNSISIIYCLNNELIIYNYTHHVYEKVTDNIMSHIVYKLINSYAESLAELELITDIVNNLKISVKHYKQPLQEGRYIPFRNGDYDIQKDKFYTDYRITKDNIIFYRLEYDYDKNAVCPKWDSFVNDIFNDNEYNYYRLQELFGYTLYYGRRLPLQKIFIFYGSGRNGKSITTEILSLMLGIENVSNTGIETLSKRFGLANLDGKKLNISSEVEKGVKVLTSILKAVSGDDTVEVEKKYADSYSVKLFCKLIINTNIYLYTEDDSTGLRDRLEVFNFENRYIVYDEKFEETENVRFQDTELKGRLEEELSGIFNWSLEGLKRLKNNDFVMTTNEEIESFNKSFLKNSNPIVEAVIQFIYECVKLEQTKSIGTSECHKLFIRWCTKNGMMDIGLSPQKFHSYFVKYISDIYGIKLEKRKNKGTVYYKEITASLN